jgi:gas vesicle protein
VANQEKRDSETRDRSMFGLLAGLLIGGLAGAVTMLLLAPQSGKDTRSQIRETGIELRDRTTEMVEDTMAQVRSGADRLTNGGRAKIKELTLQGQEMVAEQLERVSVAAQAGKKALQSS